MLRYYLPTIFKQNEPKSIKDVANSIFGPDNNYYFKNTDEVEVEKLDRDLDDSLSEDSIPRTENDK